MPHLAIGAQTEAELEWQALLQTEAVVIAPAMVAIAKIGILIMLISQVIVEHKCCGIKWFPLHILLYREAAIAQDVIVGRIADIILGRNYRGYAAAVGGIAWSQLQREAWHDIGVDKAEALGVGAGELRITLTYGRGRHHYSWVEVRDAWAIDAGGVVELKRLCSGELVLKCGLWHPVA